MDSISESIGPQTPDHRQQKGEELNLTPFSRRCSIIPFSHIVGDYLGIACAMIVYANYTTGIMSVIATIFGIGVFQYRLQIIAHDGIHFSLHSNKILNDLLVRYLITGPELTPLSLNRLNHLRHHQYLGSPQDDDWHYYATSEKYFTGAFLRWLLLEVFLGAIFVIGMKLLKQRAHSAKQQTPEMTKFIKNEIAKDLWSIVITQSIILILFALTLGIWHYLFLWIVPFALVFVPLNTLRSFCEHSIPEQDGTKANRLFTFKSNPVELFILAPHNMNLHYEHHVYMTIPYYNLPALQRAICAGAEYRTHMRGSYMAYLWSFGTGKVFTKSSS